MDRPGAAELEAMIDAEFARADSDTAETAEKQISTGTLSIESAAETRVILVDAFNVLHAVLLGRERDHGWWRREERERLLRRISGWKNGPDEIWVAFDGAQPAWSVWAEPILRPITVASRGPIVHSVYVESADDWIVRRARRSARPQQLIVVSADRKVSGRARSAGCEIWTPWAFISQCPTLSEDPTQSTESD
ncbi:MAG: NYN domain-containing protein [Myxococcales bacterium]|jgi:hypothetical protein|nr:hypothetical protein [Myxococcales bacterium]HIK83784.1 hypothetical protein [Myxococcales bacterium]